MKKFITYGVAATLTMSNFALSANVPTYADSECVVNPVDDYSWSYTGCAVKNDGRGIEADVYLDGLKTPKTITNIPEVDGIFSLGWRDFAPGSYRAEFYIDSYEDKAGDGTFVVGEPTFEETSTGVYEYTWQTDDSNVDVWVDNAQVTNFTATKDGNGNGTVTLDTSEMLGGSHKVQIWLYDAQEDPAYEGAIDIEATFEKVSDYVYAYTHQDDSKIDIWIDNKQQFSDFTVERGVTGSGTVTLDLSNLDDGKYEFEYFTNDDQKDPVYTEEITVVSFASMKAEIVDDKIETTYNEGYKGEPELKYAVEADYKDIVTVADDGTISVAEKYKTATNRIVAIEVTATDGEIVKTATVNYTIEANYTTVEASFENDKDTIKVTEETTIVIEDVDGVEYSFDYDAPYLDIDEDGKVTVSHWIFEEDTEVPITVKATADGAEITPKELTLTIEKNYTADWSKPTFEIIAGAEIKAGEPVVVEINADIETFDYVVVFNKTLMGKYENGEELTEEEQELPVYYFLEDGDYTVTAGSTIVKLSDEFVAKLPAGEYLLRTYFYDDTNIDDVKAGYAESTFTVAEAATPDTGAATKVAGGATTSALTTVSLLGAGAVLAMLAKRYAKNARK